MDFLSEKPKRQLTPEARERQRLGQYKGLLRAVLKRKADSSADYATNFDHGQMAPDFERSAEAAGETREEVRSHLSVVDRTLLTLCGFFPRIVEALSGGVSRSTLESPLTPSLSPPRGRGENRSENSEIRLEDSVAGNGLPSPTGNGPPSPAENGLPSPAGNGLPSPVGNGLPSPPWGRGAGGEGAAKSPASHEPRLPLHTDAASPRAPKLARALALLLWRPLRLFRTQEHWEWLALCYRLWELVRWRQKQGELTVERAEEFREQLDAIVDNFSWEVNRRLKLIEKRFWKVWPLYRSLVEVVEAVLGRRDSVFGFRGSGEETRDSGTETRGSGSGARDSEVLSGDRRLPIEERPASQVGKEEATTGDGRATSDSVPGSNRQSTIETQQFVDRQSTIENRQSLVQFRGTPHYEQFHPTWLDRIDELTPEAIANPFQSPSHTLKAQQKREQAAAVKEPGLWKQRAAKPHPAEQELPEKLAFHRIRYPSERELRRMVRKGELIVPGSFEDFADLVEAALGPAKLPIADCRLSIEEQPGAERRDSGLGARDSQSPIEEPLGVNQPTAAENRQSPVNRQSSIGSRQLAESLWNRTHVFSARAAELRDLLEATLLWQPVRFLELWPKLLPAGYGRDMVILFRRTHDPGHEDIAWGEPEDGEPRRKRDHLRPAIVPRSPAEASRQHVGELQHALRIWFVAVWHALVPAIRASHNVTVALYEWAVSRFGIREEFLQWRPNLSSVQLDSRSERPEWAVRVVTVTGKTLVKLRDGRVFEPEDEV